MKLVLATLLLLVALAPARAEPPSGYALYEDCVGSDVNQAACMSYIMGILDAAMFYTKPQQAPCSSGTTQGQLQMIFIKWARQNPQYLNKERGMVALASLVDAFPCPKEKPAPVKELRQ